MTKNTLPNSLTKDQAFALVDAVSEREDLTLTASAYENDDGGWIFEASCDHQPDIEFFNSLANEILGGKVGFRVEPVDTKFDYVSASLKDLKPVRAGGFYVYGSHDAANIPAGTTPIKIDAAQAFGTGHHETTTGCLEAIDSVLKQKNPGYILDVGTGTGVLAIALAKRTRQLVIASDIDAVAVKTAAENARANNVGALVHCIEATGLKHRTIAKNAPYDLVVANILAKPLTGLAHAMGGITAPGATIILSGILVSQAARVISAYRQQNIVLKERIIRADWATLILAKAHHKV